MDFSIGTLLTSFSEDKLVAPKAIEKKLGCEDPESLKRLEIVLDALEKIGVLTKERGKYRRLTEDGVVEGKLRCSSKGFCFAIQDQEDSEDIYVRESQLSNAWNGDRVLVRVTKEGRRKRSPEGEVKLILERGNPSVIARVKQTERGLRGVPLDDRLLFELEVLPNEVVPDPAAVVDQLVHVEIGRYPLGSYLPQGYITKVLGSDAESAADTELVCCKYDFHRGFNPAVEQAATALPAKLKKTDYKNRLDLRERMTVAIANSEDPESVLVDQALTLTANADGSWRLGVHIADVSHFIEPDSALDREASKRSNAVILGQTSIPLLPLSLPLGFVAEQERLALSIMLQLSAEGEVIAYEFHPSVVQVDQLLTPNQVDQALAAGPDGNTDPLLAEAYPLLAQLQTVSAALRQQRHLRGGFELQLPLNYLWASADDGVLGLPASPQQSPGRALLSEILALVNQLTLTHLQALQVPAIYRVQSPPELYAVQEFIKLTENLGIPLSLTDVETVQPQDYQNFAGKIADAELSTLLMELLLDTLSPSSNSLVSGPHFGLAVTQGYGQFTAPLQRYADLLNQRVLKAVIDEGRDRRTARAKEKVNLLHSNCLDQISWAVLPTEIHRDLETAISTQLIRLNERERIAQQAIKDLQGLQKVKQMQGRIGENFRGIITGIQSYGFFVQLEDYLVEGLVHVSSLKDDWYEYRSRQQTLSGRKNRRQYRLGDHVEVQVKSVDYYRQQIDLLVMGGGSQVSEEDLAEPVDSLSTEPAPAEASV